MRVDRLPHPVLGWNSFDCWGIFIDEANALRNLEYFIQRLKPYGFTYFCIDAGWYSEYAFMLDSENPGSGKVINNIDEYGRVIPSPKLFPRGLKYIADRCHEAGLKFGLHLMRGIPRLAVERNTPVLGTPYHAADIADTGDCCAWCDIFYGVDMSKPGAQEYYNSVLNYLSDEVGIDLLKADDLSEYPDELAAIGKAIAQCSRPVVFSLSPGGQVWEGNYETIHRYCNMFRISNDVWDTPSNLWDGLNRWQQWQGYGDESCSPDLDMIPFGALQVYTRDAQRLPNELLSGQGTSRMSNFSRSQKEIFMTQRALAASPLLFGGDLELSPQEDLDLVTNAEVIQCVKNFRVGQKVYGSEQLDIRQVEEVSRPGHGWLGIFNCHMMPRAYALTPAMCGLAEFPATMLDIWKKAPLSPGKDGKLHFSMPGEMAVLFIRY